MSNHWTVPLNEMWLARLRAIECWVTALVVM